MFSSLPWDDGSVDCRDDVGKLARPAGSHATETPGLDGPLHALVVSGILTPSLE